MKIIGVVFCCGQDSDLLPLFVQQWEALYANRGIKLVLAMDQTDPFQNTCGLKTYPTKWATDATLAHEVLTTLDAVAVDNTADFVLKLDVDCLHFRTDLVDHLPSNSAAFGFSNVYCREAFVGAAYGLNAQCVRELLSAYPDDVGMPCEDIAISMMMRLRYPNRVHLLNPLHQDSFRGFFQNKPDDHWRSCGVIHLGQNQPREAIRPTMQRLLQPL